MSRKPAYEELQKRVKALEDQVQAAKRAKSAFLANISPVSYTHLTLPTN